MKLFLEGVCFGLCFRFGRCFDCRLKFKKLKTGEKTARSHSSADYCRMISVEDCHHFTASLDLNVGILL